MDGIDIPTIATGGALAVIILILAVVGLIKGMTRMFFGFIALCAGCLAAYWGYQRGGAIAGYLISDPDAWMSGAVGLILGLAVLFAARAIFGILVKPTKVEEGKKKNQPLQGAFLGLLCGVVFAWFALSSIRYIGTLVDLQWINSCLQEEGKINGQPKPGLVKLRDVIDDTMVGSLHRDFDPLNNPTCAAIAKLRILTEHPYAISQVSVDNAMRGAFRQTDVRNFLENSQDLTAFISEGKYSHIIEAKSVKTLSKIPAAEEALRAIDVAAALGLQTKPKEKPDKGEAPEKEKANLDPTAPKPGSARQFELKPGGLEPSQ